MTELLCDGILRRPPKRAAERSAVLALENETRQSPRPFVKWVGGKTQLLARLYASMPRQFSAYHEVFVGGGALFFGLVRVGRLDAVPAYLSDVNRELISAYATIRDNVEGVIRALRRHAYDRDEFYRVRKLDPWSMSPAQRAARLIYLNRAGFNGLYRVNRRGEFNVPFGNHANPKICDAENLRAVAEALKGVHVEVRSFETILSCAQKGDLVYLDPPYVPVSSTARFVSYAENGFGFAEQEQLAQTFEALVERGVFVMQSNADVPWIRERYSDFRMVSLLARRSVNRNGDDRGPVGEVVVLGTPKRSRDAEAWAERAVGAQSR